MRPFPDPRRGRSTGDAGFTLIEVMVAFLVIAIIATAGTSLTIRGMRATMDAKQLGQAKDLVNQTVETMRGLPYFVGFSTNPGPIDVLDRYYPNTAGPAGARDCAANVATWSSSSADWTGYVSGGGRCAFEPAGDFYRTVTTGSVGSAPAVVIVASQFIGLPSGKNDGTAAPAVTPDSTYTRAVATKDLPASSQISATVTVLYGQGTGVKSTTSRTDIGDRLGDPQSGASASPSPGPSDPGAQAVVSAETKAAAVVVLGTTASGEDRELDLGRVEGDGAVTTNTGVRVEAEGASMASGTPTQWTTGASQLATLTGVVTGSAVGSSSGTSPAMSIGNTSTANVSAYNTAGDPGFGQVSPARSAVAGGGGGTFSLDQSALGLDDSYPLVRVVTPASAALQASVPDTVSGCPASVIPQYGAMGSGWMDTGAGATNTLTSCAATAATEVQLFPRNKAQSEGLVKIAVTNTFATCLISGATSSAKAGGTVTVSWVVGTHGNDPIWQSQTISWDGSTISGSLPSLTTTTLYNSMKLSDYIASWDAFGAATKTESTSSAERKADVRIPAALAITTQDVRTPTTADPDSNISITLGSATCTATDRR